MDYQVVVTEPARDDLRAIVAFIGQDSPARALTFRDHLLTEAKSLAGLPFRGRFLKGHPQVRRILCGDYLILYRVHEAKREVEVLRFWHGARGPPRV
ncbi:MAG TPA: type II toxin-antitoxin system RelE/ParE family toxin [Chthoniobacterales bacterium]